MKNFFTKPQFTMFETCGIGVAAGTLSMEFAWDTVALAGAILTCLALVRWRARK
jgi:hypothetical protein